MQRFLLALALGPAFPAVAQDWTVLEPTVLEAHPAGAEFETLQDGSVLVRGNADPERYRLEFTTELDGISALRLEVLPHADLPASGPGRAGDGSFVLSELRLATRVNRRVRSLELGPATASRARVGWPAQAAADGRAQTGWGVGGGSAKGAEAVFNLKERLGRGRRTLVLDLEFREGGRKTIGCLRVSATSAEGTVMAAGLDRGLAGLQLEINRAIDRGTAYLLKEQDLDGSWSGQRDHYPVGCTALVAYALVKSGLSPDHQAVRRALAYIDAHPPEKTYEAGCVLMCYAALGDELNYRERALDVLEKLLDWQIADWGYPGSHGDPSAGHKDLSNTQYGALGLWAATQMGLNVPARAWERLAERVLEYQHDGGRAGIRAAGFGYHPGNKVTGSMTAAGVTILALCEGHVPAQLQTQVRRGVERGLGWLDAHFNPTESTGHGNNAWLLYYLYGIERVGAFTGRKQLNHQNWYVEGARHLVKIQHGNGRWADPWGRPHSTTSYALLFLVRASAPNSGPGHARSGSTWGGDDPEVDINLRAAGDTPLTVWISSFGEPLLEAFSFLEERELGPRVARVEYLGDERVLLGDSRRGAAPWRWTTREPDEGWTQPAFQPKGWKQGPGAFGRPDSPQLTVATPWTAPELWLVRDVEIDLAQMIEPRLEVSFSAQRASGSDGPRGELLKLYDEESSFCHLLDRGGGSIRQVQDGAASGASCLAVNSRLRENARVPGWAFPIREKPGPGEYRWLQFAWKKSSGGTMVQVFFDGGTQRAQRYHAGPNSVGFKPSLALEGQAPTRWETVTRDLWKDHGDGLMTGLSLTPMGGEGHFDAIYLARSKSDFQKVRRLIDSPPEWDLRAEPESTRGGAEDESEVLAIWINGLPAVELDGETYGFETLIEGERLLDLLRRGRNRIAVHARNGGVGRALDLGIRDRRLLAQVDGDSLRPAGRKRFAARIEFPRPGRYPLAARVHLVDEVTRETVAVESEPLEVEINEALDTKMLEYAWDPTRNLLAGARKEVWASSQHGGWQPSHAVDNTQFRAWLCADGDPTPTLTVRLQRPVRAGSLLLSHTRTDRADSARTTVPTRVELDLNDGGETMVVEVDPDRLVKTVVEFGRPRKIRSFTVRVLDRTPAADPSKNAVGWAEVELQAPARRGR